MENGVVVKNDSFPYSLGVRLFSEFSGTFILCLTILVVSSGNLAGDFGSLVVSIVLMLLIYSLAKFSQAHFNPVVTIAFWRRGYCESSVVPKYILSQITAAIMASVVSSQISSINQSELHFSMDLHTAFLAEIAFTFALILTIIFVATNPKTEGNSYYGIAIALVVFLGATVVGEHSFASFNPAVSSSLFSFGIINSNGLIIHFLAQFIAGILAVQAFKASK